MDKVLNQKRIRTLSRKVRRRTARDGWLRLGMHTQLAYSCNLCHRMGMAACIAGAPPLRDFQGQLLRVNVMSCPCDLRLAFRHPGAYMLSEAI